MDKETKNFFEKLAGINNENNEGEEPMPVSINNEIQDENEEEEEPAGGTFDESEGELTVDVYQTATNFVIESTIAGVKPEDIDISLTPESITIKGKREKEERVKTENYIHQECYWGRFSRTIILPQEIDTDKTHAGIKNGVLKVTLPKLNKSKSKKIKVKFE